MGAGCRAGITQEELTTHQARAHAGFFKIARWAPWNVLGSAKMSDVAGVAAEPLQLWQKQRAETCGASPAAAAVPSVAGEETEVSGVVIGVAHAVAIVVVVEADEHGDPLREQPAAAAVVAAKLSSVFRDRQRQHSWV